MCMYIDRKAKAQIRSLGHELIEGWKLVKPPAKRHGPDVAGRPYFQIYAKPLVYGWNYAKGRLRVRVINSGAFHFYQSRYINTQWMIAGSLIPILFYADEIVGASSQWTKRTVELACPRIYIPRDEDDVPPEHCEVEWESFRC